MVQTILVFRISRVPWDVSSDGGGPSGSYPARSMGRAGTLGRAFAKMKALPLRAGNFAPVHLGLVGAAFKVVEIAAEV